MSKNINAYFVDLDGTALDIKKNGHHWISDENVDAIQTKIKEGKYVVISTGRIGKSVFEFLDITRTTYSIQGNGSMIYKNRKLIAEYPLSTQQMLKIFEILRAHKLAVKFDGDREAYGVSSPIKRVITKKFGFTPISMYSFDMTKKYHKMVAWGKLTKLGIQKIKKEIEETIKGLSVVTSANGWTIEISHKDATKGAAAAWLAANHLKISKEETAHIGDSMNDSTAKGKVGKLIVMKNGDKRLKAIAGALGPKHKNAGLAKILLGEYSE